MEETVCPDVCVTLKVDEHNFVPLTSSPLNGLTVFLVRTMSGSQYKTPETETLVLSGISKSTGKNRF